MSRIQMGRCGESNQRKGKKSLLKIVVAILIVFACIALWMGYLFHYFSFDREKSVVGREDYAVGLTEKDFLSASGNVIMNQKGEPVILQGVNLGGWLIQEYWMCPVRGDVEQWTNLETIQILEKRFGMQKTQELFQKYEDNWITESDIEQIAALGCNVVRVPFWYRNFMINPDGDWINENPDENPGFQKLDWIIDLAQRYGLYVILDMHGCPGGQSTDHSSGSARKSELFYRLEYQDSMEKLWVAIAERYWDNPTVAAYDIMNEALVDIEEGQIDPRNILYDRMIEAIRQVDSNHIIAIEGIWWLSLLPDPVEWGWENVIYEVHTYGDIDAETVCKGLLNYSEIHQVPVYIGEFSDTKILENCRKYGLNCTSWTYKGSKPTEDTWFMYYADRMIAVDVNRDPYWLIKLKWGNCLTTKYFVANEEILSDWKR